MKKYGFLLLGALLVLPLVAHGKLALPNDVLGRLEASLEVCSAGDPIMICSDFGKINQDWTTVPK